MKSRLAESLGTLEDQYKTTLTEDQVGDAKAKIAALTQQLERASKDVNCCGTALLRMSRRIKYAEAQVERSKSFVRSL